MTVLEIVILIVVVVTAVGAVLAMLGVIGTPRRQPPGRTWIDHVDERPVAQRPSEDEPDPPIPALSRPRGVQSEGEDGEGA
jgi:hypothetical protein